jgi:hypothetical protein
MRCYACEHINSADARFCTRCGASLALNAWTQQPTPTQPSYASVPYVPPQPLPGAPVAVPAPPAYPPGQGQFGPASAPYGYVPAPAPGAAPSMVNNVTVTQTAPPQPAAPSAPAAPPVPAVATGHTGGLDALLRALYFLGSGAGVGILWAAAMSSQPYYVDASKAALAIAVTIVVLVLNFRLSSRRRP